MGASTEVKELKGRVAKIHGATKACEGAIHEIVHGDPNEETSIYEWYDQRQDAKHGWITKEATEEAIQAVMGWIPKTQRSTKRQPPLKSSRRSENSIPSGTQ